MIGFAQLWIESKQNNCASQIREIWIDKIDLRFSLSNIRRVCPNGSGKPIERPFELRFCSLSK